MAAYADLIFAEAYFLNERLETVSWDSATDTDKTKALMQATNILDRLAYIGTATGAQAFPRILCDETALPLPEAVQKATCEIAYALLDGVDPELEYENLFMQSQGYSAVRSSYDRSNPSPSMLSGVPSITAWRYIVPYLEDSRSVRLDRIS